MADPTSFDNAYYTILTYGFKDKYGRVYQGDQAATIQPGNRYVGISNNYIPGFTVTDYNLYYTTYYNEKILELEVTHAEWVGLDGQEHSIDCDEIYFEKQANNPYGNLVFYYQGTEQTRIGAGTVAALGVTVVEGIEVHLNNYVSISPVCFDEIIPGAGTRKMVTLSFNDNISDYMKETYPASAAFEYEYAVAFSSEIITAILDAQLKGQYWDPEGNAGKPTDAGGGQGDYRRPDQEVGIPSLPSVSAVDTGFIGIYNVTAAEIQDLAADLWTTNFFDSIIKNFRAPLDNIISLALVPFDGFTGDLAQIMVGNFESSAAGLKLSTTFYELDCGIVDINEYYGTYADYIHTKIQLYLPLCGVIAINPDDCMDGKIRVVYHFDVFSGDVIAFVQTITKGAWHVLYTADGNIKAELPINGQNYLSVYTNAARSILGAAGSIASGGISSLTNVMPQGTKKKPMPSASAMAHYRGGQANAAFGAVTGVAENAINAIDTIKPEYQRAGNISGTAGLMAIPYPYLIFSTPQMAVPDNFKALKGYISNLKTKISDATGYIQCSTDNVDMTGFDGATNEEVEMIKSLLAEGIYIE